MCLGTFSRRARSRMRHFHIARVRILAEHFLFHRMNFPMKQKSCYTNCITALKAPTRFELVIEVLQTFALPLGYGAITCINMMHYIKKSYIRQDVSDSDGNRTRVTAVKGRCLNRLTMEPKKKKTPRVGLEPTTTRLTAECSTIELSRNIKSIP